MPDDLPHSPAGRLTRSLYWYLAVRHNSNARGPEHAAVLTEQLIVPLGFFVRAADENLPVDEMSLDTGINAGGGHPAMLCAARLLAGVALMCADAEQLPRRDELLYRAADLAPMMDAGLGTWLIEHTLERDWRQVAGELLAFIAADAAR